MKVTLHKSTDGNLHDTAKACAKHDIKLRVLAVACVASFDTGAFTNDERGGRSLDLVDLAGFVADNEEVLRKVLADSLVVRRSRKVKAKVSDVSAAKAKVVTPTKTAKVVAPVVDDEQDEMDEMLEGLTE